MKFPWHGFYWDLCFPCWAIRNHVMELSTVGHVISDWPQTGAFDFTEIVSNHRLRPAAVCQYEYLKKTKHARCSFFRKFGVLCFLETLVLRFALLPYYRQIVRLRILKIFSQYGLSRCRLWLLYENKILDFLTNLFWSGYFSSFKWK